MARKWYFGCAELRDICNRKHGLDYEKELSYRQQAANFIQDMGQKLQVTQLCINTAIVYMQRFYVVHSFKQFHRNPLAASALFLAAKVEEQPRKLEHVIKVAHICLHRDQPQLDAHSEAYQEQALELVANENILLQTLGFNVAIDHPHTHVVRCCQLVKATKDLAQTSYFMATNSLHLTTMCLRYSPATVACVCLHLACRWSNYKIPLSVHKTEWYKYIDPNVTGDLLNELTSEFLSIFEKCPSRLKKKIMASSKASREEEETRTGTDINFQPDYTNSESLPAGSTTLPDHSSAGSVTSHQPQSKSNQSPRGRDKASLRHASHHRSDKSSSRQPARNPSVSGGQARGFQVSDGNVVVPKEDYQKRKDAERRSMLYHHGSVKHERVKGEHSAVPSTILSDQPIPNSSTRHSGSKISHHQHAPARNQRIWSDVTDSADVRHHIPTPVVSDPPSTTEQVAQANKSIFDIDSPVKAHQTSISHRSSGAVRNISQPRNTSAPSSGDFPSGSIVAQESPPRVDKASSRDDCVRSILEGSFPPLAEKSKSEMKSSVNLPSSHQLTRVSATPSMPVSLLLPSSTAASLAASSSSHRKSKKSKKEKRERHRHDKKHHRTDDDDDDDSSHQSPLPPLKLKISKLQPVPKLTISLGGAQKRPSVEQRIPDAPANKMARVLGTTREVERNFLDNSGFKTISKK